MSDMKDVMSRRKILRGTLIAVWVIILLLAIGFIYEILSMPYNLRFKHKCVIDSSTKRVESLLESGSCFADIYSSYCEFCGESMNESTYIYQKGYCEGCNRTRTTSADFCSICGGKYIHEKYVNLNETQIRSLGVARVLSIAYSVCIGVIALSIVVVVNYFLKFSSKDY